MRFNNVRRYPVILLKLTDKTNRVVGIHTSVSHAINVIIAADGTIFGETLGRPLTHQFICEIAERGSVELDVLVIDRLINGHTFGATINGKDYRGNPLEPIDCKPSEGIAVALETGANIEITADVVKKSPLYEVDNLPFVELKPEHLGLNISR